MSKETESGCRHSPASHTLWWDPTPKEASDIQGICPLNGRQFFPVLAVYYKRSHALESNTAAKGFLAWGSKGPGTIKGELHFLPPSAVVRTTGSIFGKHSHREQPKHFPPTRDGERFRPFVSFRPVLQRTMNGSRHSSGPPTGSLLVKDYHLPYNAPLILCTSAHYSLACSQCTCR